MQKYYIGINISTEESINWSILDFLLMGIPVITNECDSGRNFWCNSYNSICIKSFDPSDILNAVIELKEKVLTNKIDGIIIREHAIKLCEFQRFKFNKMIQDIFDELNIKDDPKSIFKNKFEHFMNYKNNWRLYFLV